LRHIGSGIVATRSQRGRSRHSASAVTIQNAGIKIPAVIGVGPPRLQNRSAPKLAFFMIKSPGPAAPAKSNLKINGRSDGLPMWLSLSYDYLPPY
jgi:hypothetical protein